MDGGLLDMSYKMFLYKMLLYAAYCNRCVWSIQFVGVYTLIQA